jgi:hypothetical protein
LGPLGQAVALVIMALPEDFLLLELLQKQMAVQAAS